MKFDNNHNPLKKHVISICSSFIIIDPPLHFAKIEIEYIGITTNAREIFRKKMCVDRNLIHTMVKMMYNHKISLCEVFAQVILYPKPYGP